MTFIVLKRLRLLKQPPLGRSPIRNNTYSYFLSVLALPVKYFRFKHQHFLFVHIMLYVPTGKYYTDRCDIFSYGIVIWEMLTRRRPVLASGQSNNFMVIMFAMAQGEEGSQWQYTGYCTLVYHVDWLNWYTIIITMRAYSVCIVGYLRTDWSYTSRFCIRSHKNSLFLLCVANQQSFRVRDFVHSIHKSAFSV